MDKSREHRLAGMYRSGLTLQRIADIEGVSRERIRQLIARVGVTGRDGGISVMSKSKKESIERVRVRKFMERYGCVPSSVQGVTSRERTLFRAQRRNAFDRGIEFTLTLEQWLSVWVKSGHYHDRGRGQNKFCMGRIGDIGPYAIGNVYITTNSQNIKDSYISKPVSRRKPCSRAKKLANKGWSEQGGRYGARYKGKWIGWYDNPEDARKKYLEVALAVV